jgi:hypothetical protein
MNSTEADGAISADLEEIVTAEELFQRFLENEKAALTHDPLKKGGCGDPIMNS